MASKYDLPSIRQQVFEPIKTLARIVNFAVNALRPVAPPAGPQPVRVVCISDTHTKVPPFPIPDGDILVHAGDLTNAGTPAELQAHIDWLNSLPHAHKFAISGNHDTYLDPRSRQTLAAADRSADALDWKGITYLQDSGATVRVAGRDIRIHGSPHIPACGGPQNAFQYELAESAEVWGGRLPEQVDVLLTHTPPRFHLDLAAGAALGDPALLREVQRVKPRVHVFGHIHGGKSDVINQVRGGREVVRWDEGGADRWFERVMERQVSVGALGKVLDVESWWGLAMMVWNGVGGIVRERVFDAKVPSTVMVNASITYKMTGRLLNPPQVVVI